MSSWRKGLLWAALAIFSSVAWGNNPTEDKPATKPTLAQTEATQIILDAKRIADESLRNAMETVIRQHPETERWSGLCDQTVFSIVALKFPTDMPRMQIRSALVSRAGLLATSELMTSKTLLAIWQKERLDDVTTLKTALQNVSARLESSGTIRLTLKNGLVSNDYVVAYAAADKEKIETILANEENRTIVRESYRETMHRQARWLMEREQWNDALAFWRHLRERDLVSAWLYVDAAKCFAKIGRLNESAQLAREAFETFNDRKESAFFEAIGELLLPCKDEESQRIAEAAFNRALETFDGDSEAFDGK